MACGAFCPGSGVLSQFIEEIGTYADIAATAVTKTDEIAFFDSVLVVFDFPVLTVVIPYGSNNGILEGTVTLCEDIA